ncbi:MULTISPECIES: TetR/AcrR family transcriptional regulator [Clostridium]|jgi:Transcriptional regulator|uniref:TetR family transcriptional regulator n=5 Tax=Clostridium TaxID=1485 RepID=A0AAV3W018_9CLOT|nr:MULTISPECIES: TetR/AcrR family transcriptional regulator [Clostridium]ABR35013.1 transcriptional regulator, TetR family [Clostridium beijerinckii NCIMB 8052]AIU03678.1 TetR family transcriptional regulator [Clostridium beijerinckii ATCC 35702]MBF7810351.1 TetR/AcrR family transcriptional regulator [Clostridium beijerinckii]NRT23608.1 AcrR family transcriptional regulator [Clostridium beijerinckii]NRT68815.1 AcrR family transcriptional regulator [Clostridium beijerinckii]
MTNNKTLDLRIRRTHKLLFDALTLLLSEKSFDNITITDICEKAMVHRTTFYKHFEDKYHLLDSLISQLVQNFEEKSTEQTPVDNPRQYYVNLFRLLLEHMQENIKMYSVGLLNNGSTIKVLQKIVVGRTKSRLESDEANGLIFLIPAPILSEFYSSSMVSLAIWWLENNMPLSIDEMVRYGDMLIDKLDTTDK